MYIYITHQVLARASSCSGSDVDVPSPTPIRARAIVDIYKMYGVTMPTCVDVPSSPENILSQEVPTPEKRHRLSQKTPPRKQVPLIDHETISHPPESQVLSKDPENTSPMEQAPSIDAGYVDFIRKADMELVRTYKDSSTQIVKLTEGPSGFCVALMKEGVTTTEIPTLALAPVPVEPAADGAEVQPKPARLAQRSSYKRTKVDCIVCRHILSFSPTLLTKRASS